MTTPVEVYRDDGGGCYLPAKGTGTTCYHVHAGGRWWELYDFDGVRPVVALDYGPTANREALGRPCERYELPERIVARIDALTPAP
jgi:hypothetical protein